MRLLIAALSISVGCATASEDTSAAPCGSDGGRRCPDSGAASESSIDVDSALVSDAPFAETSSDSTIAPTDGSSDSIFELDDTTPPDTAPACDANLKNDEMNCGSCGNVCPAAKNATPLCTLSKCGITCTTGFGDCDSTATNGCEANLQNDESNCGACAKKCLTGDTCTAGVCRPIVTTIETFETGSWPWSPWLNGGGSGSGSVGTSCAHDGSRGYTPPTVAPIHYYRTDVTVGASGDKLSVWFQPPASGATIGRIYMGFGASASGAYSLIAAPNTGQFFFEREIPYGTYTAIASKARTSWSAGVWYKMEVKFGAGGAVTGNLYASDGVTLLDTLSTTIAGFTPGGVALRAFGTGGCIDTLAR